MIYKDRMKLEELIALIDSKQDRLLLIDKESQLLREEIALLTTELMSRTITKTMSDDSNE